MAIVKLVYVEGQTYKLTGDALGIKEQTVEAHLMRIYKRMGFQTAREANTYFRQIGFLRCLGVLNRPGAGRIPTRVEEYLR